MTTTYPEPLRKLQLVTLDSVADALAVSKRTLQRLIQAGEFPAPIKVGATTRVRLADVERYIERQQRKGGH